MDFQLTDRAMFPDTDLEAAKNVCASVGILFDFIDNIVRTVNDDPEVLQLWDIGRGLQGAAEMYYAKREPADV